MLDRRLKALAKRFKRRGVGDIECAGKQLSRDANVRLEFGQVVIAFKLGLGEVFRSRRRRLP